MSFDNDLLHKFGKELDEDEKEAIMQGDIINEEDDGDDYYDDYTWESEGD